MPIKGKPISDAHRERLSKKLTARHRCYSLAIQHYFATSIRKDPSDAKEAYDEWISIGRRAWEELLKGKLGGSD